MGLKRKRLQKMLMASDYLALLLLFKMQHKYISATHCYFLERECNYKYKIALCTEDISGLK